jgi:fatty acid amide hydrolase
MAMVMNSTKERSPQELISMLTRIEEFKREFEEYWVNEGFDAVISPAGSLPAVPHKFSSEIFCLNAHFSLYNILDFPAGVVPVRLVQTEDLKQKNNQATG